MRHRDQRGLAAWQEDQLDALLTFQAERQAAGHVARASAPPAPPQDRHRWWRRWSRTSQVAVGFGALLVCGAAGTAVALSGGGHPRPNLPPTSPINAVAPPLQPKVAAADPALTAGLRVFRAPSRRVDVPPSDIIDSDMRAKGANPALARLAGKWGTQTVYLVPARGGLCVASTMLLAHGCYSTADVLAARVVGTMACYPYMPAAQQEMFGILPGATNAEVHFKNGATQPLPMSNDVFVLDATAPFPTSITWTDRAGAHSLLSGMAAMPHPCTDEVLRPNGETTLQAVAKMRKLIGAGVR